MDFQLTGEQLMLQEMIRTFVDKEIAPSASAMDDNRLIPKELINKMAAMGLMGIYMPAAHGGSGLDVISYVVALEQIARGSASVGVMISVNNSLVSDPINRFGSEMQKEKFLQPLAEGTKLGCFALTEAGSGSDAFSLSTSAKKVDGGYRLDGSKIFISSGAIADIAIIFATGDRSLKHKGVSAFIVDKTTEGFSVGKRENKLGLLASDTVELIFDNMFVPEENLLGMAGEGYKVALSAINGGRIGIAAESIGIAQASLEVAAGYAGKRKQFGQPVGEFQGVGFMLADMATEIDAARMLTYRAAWLKESGEPFIKEASMAKLYASEMANRVAYNAIQVLGGSGYIKDYPAERYFRDARVNTLYEGTSEIQRALIAKEILNQYG